MQLAIVVPCFNEEEVFPETVARLRSLMTDLQSEGEISDDSYVLFVDDGSSDRTWPLIAAEAADDTRVRGLKLSRNRGHQYALLAGLHQADADMIVSIDADLQDDPAAIKSMVRAFHDGSDVVLGVRNCRESDDFFKRFTAEGYYRLLKLLGVEIVFNHADFRLLSRRAMDALMQFQESNIFLRGIIPQLGFKTSIVEYERHERFAGESKYPLRKMLALAWQGVTSFTNVPLRTITMIGFIVSLFSLLGGAWALGIRLLSDQAIPGWASVVIPMFFLGGVQLLSLGIIGEYLAKVYVETKRRPKYIIEEAIGMQAKSLPSP